MIRRATVLLVACGLLSLPAVASASLYLYDIKVSVTAVGAPGSFASDPYNFAGFSNPTVYTGSFEADNSASGPISNFSLVIGGVQMGPGNFGSVLYSAFDPSSSALVYVASDSGSAAGVAFAYGTAPSNYVAGLENNNNPSASNIDPYYSPYIQNWAGTFSITQVGAVDPPSAPEPATGALAVVGVIGAVVAARRRRRAG